MSERVQLEASLRGIWVLGYDTPLGARQGRDTDVLRIPAERVSRNMPTKHQPGSLERELLRVRWLSRHEPIGVVADGSSRLHVDTSFGNGPQQQLVEQVHPVVHTNVFQSRRRTTTSHY